MHPAWAANEAGPLFPSRRLASSGRSFPQLRGRLSRSCGAPALSGQAPSAATSRWGESARLRRAGRPGNSLRGVRRASRRRGPREAPAPRVAESGCPRPGPVTQSPAGASPRALHLMDAWGPSAKARPKAAAPPRARPLPFKGKPSSELGSHRPGQSSPRSCQIGSSEQSRELRAVPAAPRPSWVGLEANDAGLPFPLPRRARLPTSCTGFQAGRLRLPFWLGRLS